MERLVEIEVGKIPLDPAGVTSGVEVCLGVSVALGGSVGEGVQVGSIVMRGVMLG